MADDAMTIRQIGTVKKIGQTITVEWEDNTKERISATLLPANIAKAGQRFEAMVTRDKDWNMIAVAESKALEPLKPMSEKEADDLWASLPTASSKPRARWD